MIKMYIWFFLFNSIMVNEFACETHTCTLTHVYSELRDTQLGSHELPC